eukprot:242191-Pelagomonas_calceolata.AAC.4
MGGALTVPRSFGYVLQVRSSAVTSRSGVHAVFCYYLLGAGIAFTYSNNVHQLNCSHCANFAPHCAATQRSWQ